MRVAIAAAAAVAVASGTVPLSGGSEPWLPPAPGDYYADIDTALSGLAFQQNLTALVSIHGSLTYAGLWAAFNTTDVGQSAQCGDGTLADIYSTYCWRSPAQQCGNYQREGDCYNRCVGRGALAS